MEWLSKGPFVNLHMVGINFVNSITFFIIKSWIVLLLALQNGIYSSGIKCNRLRDNRQGWKVNNKVTAFENNLPFSGYSINKSISQLYCGNKWQLRNHKYVLDVPRSSTNLSLPSSYKFCLGLSWRVQCFVNTQFLLREHTTRCSACRGISSKLERTAFLHSRHLCIISSSKK